MSDFDAAYWDARYEASTSVWGARPNRWVEQELRDLPPGRALDLACGEGRNALWLARRGWTVLAVDFSVVALDKGRAAEPALGHVEWLRADATTFRPARPVDVALLSYLQVPATARRAAVSNAAAALAPGGTLLVVAHDARNLGEGTGGPQRPEVLYSGPDLEADIGGTDLVVVCADVRPREVEGADRPALDCVFRARRPQPPPATQ